ncbi:MAG: radical SAM protein, partial [Phycisphaerae bacterium]|nr:radical SAM protein [Phycisphaerae bacterium]
GIKNCFVSNGFMTPRAVRTIAPYLDAINVDLKAFRDETYRRVMKAALKPVLTCLKELLAAGVWVEVTTLVVPGLNDSEAELSDIAGFIAGDLGVDVPWHVSRFHGDYKMTDTPSTPMETLVSAIEAGRRAGLRYLYCGNVPAGQYENTCCPNCGAVLIRRTGFHVAEIHLSDARCPNCSTEIAGIWN